MGEERGMRISGRTTRFGVEKDEEEQVQAYLEHQGLVVNVGQNNSAIGSLYKRTCMCVCVCRERESACVRVFPHLLRTIARVYAPTQYLANPEVTLVQIHNSIVLRVHVYAWKRVRKHCSQQP
jgi:hypothetical protein